MPTKHSLLFKLYVALECGLFLALLAFQIITISKGYRIYNQEGPYSLYIGIFQISLTSLTFLFGLFVFFAYRKDRKTRLSLFPLYFLAILIADVFFSFSPVPIGGHICFLVAYILFFFIHKGKWWEGLLALGLGGMAMAVMSIIGKLSPSVGVDCFLGAVLICNMAACWVNYGKGKDKNLLPVCIALTLIILSDGSIAVRAFLTSFPINHVFALITWPTYVAGDIILAFTYLRRAQSSYNLK